MADPLVSLAASIPEWLQRLGGLAAQVSQRQRDLAHGAGGAGAGAADSGADSAASAASLRPGGKEQVEDRCPAPRAKCSDSLASNKDAGILVAASEARSRTDSRPSPFPGPNPGHGHRAGGWPSKKYRTHSRTVVYYDSYVQAVFEDLVRFMSASRNQLRKAKLSARVTQLRQTAAALPESESDLPLGGTAPWTPGGGGGNNSRMPTMTVDALTVDDTMDGDDNYATQDLPPLLHYKRTMVMRSPGTLATGRPMYRRATARGTPHASGAAGAASAALLANRRGRTRAGPEVAAAAAPDVLDELDTSLEAVQALCEHAAHQFLRDGDCGDEVAVIRQRLAETQARAEKEAARAEAARVEAVRVIEEDANSEEGGGGSINGHIDNGDGDNARKYRAIVMQRRDKVAPTDGLRQEHMTSDIDIDEGVHDMGGEV